MDIKRLYSSGLRKLKRTLHINAHKDTDALRWGIIGLGNMAQFFADALNGNAGSILSAVASRCDDKALAFAKRNGAANSYGTYEAMLNDSSLKLDVVYVATPAKYHYEHVKLCLEHGKNVLCEKPATLSAQEFSELVDLAEKNHCFFMEGMWMKCLPVFKQAFEWFSQGRIGELKLIRADLYKREHVIQNRYVFKANEGGGVINDYGVYALAFVEAFMGYPDEVHSHDIKSSFGVDSDWQIHMKKDAIQGFINISSDFQSSSKAVLIGTEGSIEFAHQFNRTNAVSLYGKEGLLIEKKEFSYRYDGFEYEIDHVKQLIRAGALCSDIVSLSSTLNVLRIMEQITSVDE